MVGWVGGGGGSASDNYIDNSSISDPVAGPLPFLISKEDSVQGLNINRPKCCWNSVLSPGIHRSIHRKSTRLKPQDNNEERPHFDWSSLG